MFTYQSCISSDMLQEIKTSRTPLCIFGWMNKFNIGLLKYLISKENCVSQFRIAVLSSIFIISKFHGAPTKFQIKAWKMYPTGFTCQIRSFTIINLFYLVCFLDFQQADYHPVMQISSACDTKQKNGNAKNSKSNYTNTSNYSKFYMRSYRNQVKYSFEAKQILTSIQQSKGDQN